ncbi:fumarylacetoacetate hydrolase family protein [Microbacterium aquilitoris]|uniref:fumarylacetoacetate hydrolase family protein n=1 Tax=Microbacterium aquilitoris TaxID=3067307 RepID=UPI00288D9991|nr:fumarylacetoacetate hydrolase family protein [Microbacterium sp. KSW2-22]MDT3345007.1 fumarylacetoacetate hydrolase family protein [Microbacterium sp. KSW2-22]
MHIADHLASPADALPVDHDRALLIGRVWDPAAGGPTPVLVTADEVRDLSGAFATVSALTAHPEPAAAVRAIDAPVIGRTADVLAGSASAGDDRMRFLSPVDLHCVKAAGVTFAVSMIERVIEEKARGDAEAADGLRAVIVDLLGGDLRSIVPGSEAAAALKAHLVERDMWSQYLEVGIGSDAEIFTKSPVLASMGTGARVGIHRSSTWNNPEPEVVVIVAPDGRVVGAALGNDVNLRDVEGRSALLLPKAKDNNASGSLGPFIRLFDADFGIEDVRTAQVDVTVDGDDGFRLDATSDMTQISRDPLDLAGQLLSPHHQYPDGAALYLGTLFAPVQDRDEPGRGFTHHPGDVVRIASPRLGTLVNEVAYSDECAPWTFGIAQLMVNLHRRGLLR